MITAAFDFSGKSISGFTLSGHSGFAESGSDIVCSAASSAAFMTANTVTEILKLHPKITERDGFLSLSLAESECAEAQTILQGFLLHMQELAKMYPDFIKIERGAENA